RSQMPPSDLAHSRASSAPPLRVLARAQDDVAVSPGLAVPVGFDVLLAERGVSLRRLLRSRLVRAEPLAELPHGLLVDLPDALIVVSAKPIFARGARAAATLLLARAERVARGCVGPVESLVLAVALVEAAQRPALLLAPL